MRNSIRCIALMLMLCLVFSAAGTVTAADTWEATIKRYDALFATTDGEPALKFKELYTALLLDPETFINQLAFRVKETKEYVLYILTGDWVTLGQFERMIEVVSAQDPDAASTYSENAFLKDMLYHLESAFYSREQNHRVLKSLFVEVTKHDLPTDSFCRELQLSVVQEPREFIVQLAQEDAEVQDLIIACLQLELPYNTLRTLVFLKLAQEYNIHREQMDYFTEAEMELVSGIIWGIQIHPTVPTLADPNTEELQQWLTETKPLEIFTAFNYEILLTNINSEYADSLMNALLYDTANFVNELAFRDVETKNKVLDAFETAELSDLQLKQMYLRLQTYQHSAALTKSETDLLDVLMCYLDTTYYSRPQPHRNCKIMFAEAVSDSIYERLPSFCDELKIAFIANPRSFIIQLAQEQEFVQEKVISLLCSESQISDALFMNVVNTWALERKNSAGAVGYYTEEEFALLQQFSQHLQMVPNEPQPTDPDPEEYEKWLEEKGLLTDDPGMTLPIYPAPTPPEPSETAASEETQSTPDEDPEKDIGWVSTICFTLAFLCLGIAAGSVMAKRKKAKAAKQAESQPQTPPQVPAQPYPKLLYCPAPLERDVQKQITLALRQKYDEYSIHWYHIKNPDGTCRCYGTDGDHHIIFYAGGLRLEIPASCTIGENTFRFGTGFELFACRDGVLTDLNTALEQGLVSHQAVKDARIKHESISQ